MCDSDPVYKLFIQDLRSCQNSENGWRFKFSQEEESVIINKFQIQVTIAKVNGYSNEILIVSDGTGEAKATRGPKVPGEFSWIKPGVYCSIVGSLLDNGRIPHVNIIKLAKLNNQCLQAMWPEEVTELKDLLCKKIYPRVTFT